MAIEHLLDNSTERTRATRLVASVTLATYQSGQLTTVQRWFAALGDAGDRGLSAARRAGGLDCGAHRPVVRGRSVGRRARVRLVRPDARRRLGVVRVRPRDAPRRSCAPADRSRRWPMPSSRSPRSRPGVRGATRRSRCSARRSCSPASVDEAEAAFTECSATAGARDNTDVLIVSESELAVLAMDHGRWAEAAEHVRGGPRRDRPAAHARLRHRRARLRRTPRDSPCTTATWPRCSTS